MRGSGGARRRDRGDGMGGHVPRHRRAAASRICRDIGLAPAFTIHDREDFGRPDELRPPRARLFQNRKALSDQGHLPRHLFARGERRSRARGGSRRVIFRGAPCGTTSWQALFGQYVEAKQRQQVLDYDDLLLYWAHMMQEPAIARGDRRALRSRAGRRISGHQQAPGLGPAGAAAERQRA